MKLYKYFYIFSGFLLLGFYGCSKNLVPSDSKVTSKENYDVASFNYGYVEALKLKLMGNGGEALKFLEQCIKINPSSDAAYYQIAQILIASGDIRNGKRYVSKALVLDQNNLWYLTTLAGLYYQEKNLDSAIIFYERAVKYFPEKTNLQLTLGNLYSENKKFERASSIFESFDKKYGVNEVSTLSSVKNLLEEKKYNEALDKTLSLLKQYPDEILYYALVADIYQKKGENQKARDVYDRLMEKTPDNPQVQLSLCDFLISEKRYNELFTLLSKVIINSGVEKENKISLLARLIDMPELIKDWSNNLVISVMVLESTYEKDDIVPLLRPEIMIKQSKLKEASLRLEEIISSNPENYYAWEKLLFAYLQMKDYSKLFTIGEECATKFNRSFIAKVLYANGAIEINKYSIALEELRKAEILAGDNKDFIMQVLTMRADVFYRMKDFSKAFETFENALKTNNEDLTVLNNYAYYLAEQNTNLKEAEQMARKVIEKEKGNTTFLDTYGWVLYKRGKLNEAARIMESVINSGESPDPEWFEHYGYILKKQRKCSQAIENWNIALKLDSSKTGLIKEIRECEK